MEETLTLDGKTFISSKRAARITGYTPDYIGQLCRAQKINAKLVGRSWYVEENSIKSHQVESRSVVTKPTESLAGEIKNTNENKQGSTEREHTDDTNEPVYRPQYPYGALEQYENKQAPVEEYTSTPGNEFSGDDVDTIEIVQEEKGEQIDDTQEEEPVAISRPAEIINPHSVLNLRNSLPQQTFNQVVEQEDESLTEEERLYAERKKVRVYEQVYSPTGTTKAHKRGAMGIIGMFLAFVVVIALVAAALMFLKGEVSYIRSA